jgi:hypothetical protein
LKEFTGKRVRAFVVWEPVLLTDWAAPSSMTLGRISDWRAAQFWDKQRLISHSMGEHNRRGIVWDYIGVYPAGVTWNERPPQPLYEGRPVTQVTEPARAAIARALQLSESLKMSSAGK